MSRTGSMSTSPYNTDAAGLGFDHNQGPPRKKMRKGTKSCLECRRRKIKCNFEPGRPAVCNECYARGSTCIDQEHGDIHTYTQSTSEQSSYSLRERVSQLEDLVKQVLNRLPEKDTSAHGDSSAPESDKSQLDAQAAEVLKSLKSSLRQENASTEESIVLPGGLRDDAPALTLFDNAVIERKESQPVVSRAQYNKTKTLLAALNKLLPSASDLEIILEQSHEWWTIWRKMFPEITDSRCETIRESVSHSLRSEKPAELAKIMLCIAISIHQLPGHFNWSRLQIKEEPADLMERYIATVDKLITSDDEIAATLDGIECMMLEAKYHVNMGRPRRAWLLFHRALAFAQLLGIHRLAAQTDKTSLDYQRSVNIWCHLVLGDRYLSLLLGLPYSVSESFVTPYIPVSGPRPALVNDGEHYVGKMLPIITKMIDRNQSVVPMGYSATLRLDQELEELHSTQDPSWWATDLIPGSAVEDHFDRLQAQFFHHQAKVMLHMPFMLRSSTDKRYQYSHAAALDGAREMIRVYKALRTNKAVGPFICKLIDFQSFTGAMLLLLNLCGYSQQHRGNNAQQTDLEQDQQDSDLIDETITLLKDAAKEPGGVVAAQSAQALEMLARVRQGCDDDGAKECRGETCQVSIPYFGTISIGTGKHFVPIKPGTYVQRTQETPANTTVPAGGVSANTGLPTPPSVASNSTQPSPLTTTIDRQAVQYSQARRPPVYESTNYIAPGLDQAWPDTGDDPFITFDSFMAFPPQPPTDFPSAGGVSISSSGSGFTPQPSHSLPGQSSPYNNSGTTPQNDLNASVAAGGLGSIVAPGFPFGSFPFGQSGVDLDQGWNWFGVDAPVIP
ncbi:uncharacterized protein Z519_00259 [Cladophialophora bantiana CBS 173.52]|uniref:Zn(2)-C6 fungal-type domain-containing protein n=1 Tax=Cladophialophora bantiana (strain ATCC 10958 / CBS 173.52 / CDC B-1940 / NIH 8579) TaxID=1442370 RepID=A0A0D2HYR5_CLAB1|nr:uncharacterized protein Z519_00259 [Cladophialophora bantiana CBS 173.52]KIW98598.1 hypothetical protein Z519_00259 [Cladophialophora bantiana CBS 173.52]